ncbi:B1 bradykinin receptor [Chanos chanos]|uniref:B1 bradykinin receptor n=1 Tax=Chanos chanos TaxID=29144 RepID=A0A6J2WNG5_CHACN|nr:B2 bradykinin receptor-like [Chanos chanos]
MDLQSTATEQNQNITPLPLYPDAFNTTEWHLVYSIIPPYIFIICLTGISGNTFVLLVFLFQRSPWNVPEIYLGSLVLADLLFLLCLPFWAINILNYFHWTYGEVMCKVVNMSIIVNMYSSVYMIAMVNVDRYLALVQTMRARWFRKKRYAKVICLVLWLFGFVMSAPVAVHRTIRYIPGLQITACILDYPSNTWRLVHHFNLILLGFLLPFLVIVFCSCSIIRVLRKRSQNISIQERNDRKATVLVCAVTVLFLVCWGPFQVVTFLDILCDYKILDEEVWYHALDIGSQSSTYLACLNSCLNPLLYVCSGQYFRRKVSEMYKRRKISSGSVVTALQRSIVSTYLTRRDQTKPVVI